MDQTQIKHGVGGRAEVAQWRVIGRVSAVLRHRQMQEVQPPVEVVDQPVGDLHQDAGVLRHHQMGVARGAIAEVIAEFDISRHRVSQTREFGGNVGFVRVGTVGK